MRRPAGAIGATPAGAASGLVEECSSRRTLASRQIAPPSSLFLMKLDLAAAQLRSLLDAPSPATLTVYRGDGEAITSPVWFRVHDDAFEVVVAASDRKLEHLRRDPRAVLLVFESVRPFRGVQVRGRVTIEPDEGARTRLAIASRYLGPEGGSAYADLALRPPGFVVRLPLSAARAWDLADKVP